MVHESGSDPTLVHSLWRSTFSVASRPRFEFDSDSEPTSTKSPVRRTQRYGKLNVLFLRYRTFVIPAIYETRYTLFFTHPPQTAVRIASNLGIPENLISKSPCDRENRPIYSAPHKFRNTRFFAEKAASGSRVINARHCLTCENPRNNSW